MYKIPKLGLWVATFIAAFVVCAIGALLSFTLLDLSQIWSDRLLPTRHQVQFLLSLTINFVECWAGYSRCSRFVPEFICWQAVGTQALFRHFSIACVGLNIWLGVHLWQ